MLLNRLKTMTDQTLWILAHLIFSGFPQILEIMENLENH